MNPTNKITIHSEKKLKAFQIVWVSIMLLLTILQCMQHFYYYLNYQKYDNLYIHQLLDLISFVSILPNKKMQLPTTYFVLSFYEIFLSIYLFGLIIFLSLKKRMQSRKEMSGIFLSTLILVLINANGGFLFLAATIVVVIIPIFHFSYRKK